VLSALHRYIMDSKDFIGYWNYIPFVYIVKSYESLPVLREKFRYILTNGSFLLAEISGPHVDGLLPREAWEWFWHSHAQLSLAEVLQQQLGPTKPPAGIGGVNLLGGIAGLLGDQTTKK
jgi:hypothetical protein